MEQKEIKVLDKGFCRLVDFMGSDNRVVQSARVSYGEGTKTFREDKDLIRYLMRHQHTSPFEQVIFVFHMKLPVFVARQIIRHRTACLSGDTYIYFDLPGGIKRKGNQIYKIKVKDVWERLNGTNTNDFKKKRIKNAHLRQINEENLKIQYVNIVDVFKNGIKPVFEITLEDGKKIKATADHKFFFSDGWNTLKGKMGLYETNKVAVWTKGDYYLYVNGMEENVPKLYYDKDWLQEMYHNKKLKLKEIAEICFVSTHTIRKWLKIFGLQRRHCFAKGHKPWNFGKTYKTGSKKITPEGLNNIKKARSGENSNFWKGGVTPERQNIGRWTTQIAHKIHEKNGWTCQLCKEKKSKLACHHIIPVWADVNLARDENNLTTLCEECHKIVNQNELDYVELLSGPSVRTKYIKKERKEPHNKLNFAKLVRIEKIVFIGEEETFDVEVNGPFHNFIANGIVTHNSVNEVSARYSEVPEEFYIPDIENLQKQSKNNKQGRGETFEENEANHIISNMKAMASDEFKHYHWMIDKDVAREIARINLPVSSYTEWYWQMDLRNLFHFLELRLDEHAQYETRQYANAIYEIIKPIVPICCEAFEDYMLNSCTFSAQEMALIRDAFMHIDIEQDFLPEQLSKLSKRELSEFKQKLRIK